MYNYYGLKMIALELGCEWGNDQMDKRSKLPGSSEKVTSIRGRRSSLPAQRAGQYESTSFFLLNSLQAIVDGIVAMRWMIAVLILFFIGDPDLHDAIVNWALELSSHRWLDKIILQNIHMVQILAVRIWRLQIYLLSVLPQHAKPLTLTEFIQEW